jgi:hypothetical protein
VTKALVSLVEERGASMEHDELYNFCEAVQTKADRRVLEALTGWLAQWPRSAVSENTINAFLALLPTAIGPASLSERTRYRILAWTAPPRGLRRTLLVR